MRSLRRKQKIIQNGQRHKPKSKLKRRSACGVVKGTAGPPLDACLVKNELEAFLSYINENMITEIVGRTNDQTCKVRKKINADEFLFHYSDTNEGEIKCLFGLLYFRGLYHGTKQPTKELWYDTFSARNIQGSNVIKQIRVPNENNNIS